MSFSFTDFHTQAKKVLDHLKTEAKSLRTGRASVELLDTVMVEAYGTRMKLVEVASVTAPDPSLLLIQPWDKGLVEVIEKGILAANLNLSPAVSGDSIRISIPPLTGEKRKELVKMLHQKAEAAKVMLRTARTECKQAIEEQTQAGGVSEDQERRDLEELEKNVKQYSSDLDAFVAQKEKDLLSL